MPSQSVTMFDTEKSNSVAIYLAYCLSYNYTITNLALQSLLCENNLGHLIRNFHEDLISFEVKISFILLLTSIGDLINHEKYLWILKQSKIFRKKKNPIELMTFVIIIAGHFAY